jgi:hypothetical protein
VGVCAATSKQAAKDTRSDKSASSARYDFDFTSWINCFTSDSSMVARQFGCGRSNKYSNENDLVKEEANQVCDFTKNSEDHDFAEKKPELG